VAVSPFLQNEYDISVLDNEKAYVNNPHWLQELYDVSRNFLQEVGQPAQKLEVTLQDSSMKQGKKNCNGRTGVTFSADAGFVLGTQWRTEGGGLGCSNPPPPEIPKISVKSSIA